jgi:hypothetical protein
MAAGELDPALLAAIQEAVAAGMAALPPPQPLAAPEVTPLVMVTTPKLGLKQPGLDDPALVTDLNDNMTILDNSITATQVVTLTNKTLDAPVINNPTITGWTNAQHTHLNAAGAGALDGAAITSGTLGTGFLLRETGPSVTDPLLRDTLWFGAKPSGAGDTSLQRTGVKTLRLENKLTLGVALAPWDPARSVVQIGNGSLEGTATAAILRQNSYTTAASLNKAITTGVGSSFSLDASGLFYYTAPSVAADADQAFVLRALFDTAGNLGLGITPPALHPNRRALFIADAGMLMSGPGYNALEIRVNSYQNAANAAVAMGASPAGSIGLVNDTFAYANAASVAAGALQTFKGRFTIAAAGNMVLACDAAANPFQCTVGGTGSFIIANGASTATNARLYTGPGSLELDPTTGYITPPADNTKYLGAASLRFTGMYVANAPVVGSSLDLKEDITPLDPEACVASVLETDWLAYTYKAAPPPLRAEEADDEAWDAQQEAYAKMVVETAVGRRQKGYVLDSPDHKVGPEFGLPDRKNRSDGADLAVVACALQQALQRIAVLEEKLAAQA